MTRQTQQERLLSLLRSKEWVSLPKILDLRIAKYSSRITELRHAGYIILNRKEESPAGEIHSWYHLAGEPEPEAKSVRPHMFTKQKEMFA